MTSPSASLLKIQEALSQRTPLKTRRGSREATRALQAGTETAVAHRQAALGSGSGSLAESPGSWDEASSPLPSTPGALWWRASATPGYRRRYWRGGPAQAVLSRMPCKVGHFCRVNQLHGREGHHMLCAAWTPAPFHSHGAPSRTLALLCHSRPSSSPAACRVKLFCGWKRRGPLGRPEPPPGAPAHAAPGRVLRGAPLLDRPRQLPALHLLAPAPQGGRLLGHALPSPTPLSQVPITTR